MGSGFYYSDVRTAEAAVRSAPRESSAAFDYDAQARSGRVTKVHPDLDILGRLRECFDTPEHPLSTPIAIGMDVTRSRGDDAKAIYAEVPRLLGVLKSTGYVTDPQIMWAAIGDAHGDRAPLQVGQFESDRRIDEQLAKIWMEEGGGGTGEESYELFAYYLANKTKLDCVKRGERGFVFFTGDEAPYPTLDKLHVETYIGDKLKKATTTSSVFQALQQKFNPFLIFPRSTMEQRVKSIDEEIRKRLVEAGGKFEEVSIRCSLIWENRNDLDLHCCTPGGEEIYYGSKKARCSGELDVDRNVQGETTKPVENIRWGKGLARPGRYTFWVENYAYHESDTGAVPFKVELDVEGKIQTFTGKTPARSTRQGSKQIVFEFDYVPDAGTGEKDSHAAYADEVVLEKWTQYNPATQILRIADPKSAVEVMLGVLALTKGGLGLTQFDDSMKQRGVTKERRSDVVSALQEFAARGALTEVGGSVFT